jgi:uncharacterized protein (TIRG00374 family)
MSLGGYIENLIFNESGFMTPMKFVMLALKLLVTGFLFWLLLQNVDISVVWDKLGNVQLGWAVMAVAALMVQLLLTGLRWYYVSQLVNAFIRRQLALRLILVGQFFNQILPSSVGGDAVRAWLLSREGLTIRHSMVSVICDRGVALILLTVIVAFTMPLVIFLGDVNIPSALPMAISIITLVVIGLLSLFLFGKRLANKMISSRMTRPLGVLVRDLCDVLFSSGKSVRVIAISVVVQIIVVISIYYCGLALGVDLKLVQLSMLPLILLVSSIPISFAGWGLREGAMVAGLGFAGVSAGDALAISVGFGVAQLLIGLPGAFIGAVSMLGFRKNTDANL